MIARRCGRGVLILAAGAVLLAGCSQGAPPDPPPASTAAPSTVPAQTMDQPASPAPPAVPSGAQPALASDPAQLADDLIADEEALRTPSTPEPALTSAARRQQAAYRAIGRSPEWDPIIRPRIPAWLIATYDLNVDARRQLYPLTEVKDTVPAWRIVAPAPADALLANYREAEAATGVPWNYLAAIHLIETRFGSIEGTSTAGAQGPMQFLPSTFEAYGDGGDIHSLRDSIMAAGRYLAANNFAGNRDNAIFRYNNSDLYVRAVNDYAEVLASDPAAFDGYHRWDVYYRTTAGDVLLPIGYMSTTPIPVEMYLADHPQ